MNQDEILIKNRIKIEQLTSEKLKQFIVKDFDIFKKNEYLSKRYFLFLKNKEKNFLDFMITTDENGKIYSFSFINKLEKNNEKILNKENNNHLIQKYLKIIRLDHIFDEFKLTKQIKPGTYVENDNWLYCYHKKSNNYIKGENFTIEISKHGDFISFSTIYNGIDYKCNGELKVSREEALKTAMNFLIDDLGYKEKDITIESLDSVSNSVYFRGLTGKEPFYVYPNNFKYMLSNKLIYLYKEFFDKPKKEGRLAWVFGFDIRGYSQWVMNLMVDAETGKIIGGY